VIQEVLGALRVVRAFGQEDREHDRFLARSSDGMRARVRLSIVEGVYGLLIGALVGTGGALVLYVGVRQVQNGTMTLGDLLLVTGYVGQLYQPLKAMAKRAGTLQSHLASAERVFALLDEQPETPERPDAVPLARAAGAVEFADVWFAYEESGPVLKGATLAVSPGTKVGVSGATGAGKTTLMALLTRLYDPDAGCIRLDGRDIRDYRLADLRDQFGIVLQEPVLFSTSIAENIAYARPEAAAHEIVAAACAAGAHDFITSLPEGYDTTVGERGMRLSGGERQRISLARAFLKDAPILILDEPTSSVDIMTEAAILDAMRRLMEGRTSFMIAHRLSTLDLCDVRIEVQAGRLVATGPVSLVGAASSTGPARCLTRSPRPRSSRRTRRRMRPQWPGGRWGRGVDRTRSGSSRNGRRGCGSRLSTGWPAPGRRGSTSSPSWSSGPSRSTRRTSTGGCWRRSGSPRHSSTASWSMTSGSPGCSSTTSRASRTTR
jgi:ATP-binding cassette subfamily B protein